MLFGQIGEIIVNLGQLNHICLIKWTCGCLCILEQQLQLTYLMCVEVQLDYWNYVHWKMMYHVLQIN
jgi:hypothetical protein